MNNDPSLKKTLSRREFIRKSTMGIVGRDVPVFSGKIEYSCQNY